jgi:voltage-gated potassium channel
MSAKNKPTVWQFVILCLSVFVLAILAIETFVKPGPDVASILQTCDTLICFVFIGDFFARLFRARDKMAFLKWGWIDLVSSIPALDMFRWGRAVRVIRILRVLRAIRSLKVLVSFFFANRNKSIFASALLTSLTLITFASVAILNLEDAPQSNITSAEDAMWWSLTTMTTVGYGDRFPVTTGGRLLGAVLMTAGIGLFGIFTGYLASWFVGDGDEKQDELAARLDQLEKRIVDLTEAVKAISTPNGEVGTGGKGPSAEPQAAGAG